MSACIEVNIYYGNWCTVVILTGIIPMMYFLNFYLTDSMNLIISVMPSIEHDFSFLA